MIKVRNTNTGAIAPGYLELLKRSTQVDFLEVLDGDRVVRDVQDLIDNFNKGRARKEVSAQKAPADDVAADDTVPLEEAADLASTIQKATKDELIEIALDHFGESLDKRKKVDTLRAELLGLLEG